MIQIWQVPSECSPSNLVVLEYTDAIISLPQACVYTWFTRQMTIASSLLQAIKTEIVLPVLQINTNFTLVICTKNVNQLEIWLSNLGLIAQKLCLTLAFFNM